jgi:hypothetical protein
VLLNFRGIFQPLFHRYLCTTRFDIAHTIIMNSELSGISMLRSKMAAVCAGENGTPSFSKQK